MTNLVTQARVRIPHPENYNKFENLAKFKKFDHRFLNYDFEPQDKIVVYKPYMANGSYQTGFDIAVILLDEIISSFVDDCCNFYFLICLAEDFI